MTSAAAPRATTPLAATIDFATPDVTSADLAAVARVLARGWLTTGDECAALEAELAERLGAPHVVAVSSCTAAIELTLRALDLPSGARVGVPSWTFVSTALPAVHLGAQIVVLDVDPDTLNLSIESLDAVVDSLDVVIPVHFGGVAVHRAVHERCVAAGVTVIEDAAHALAARDHRGMVAGQGSAAACFSFYATKNITSGEGGALVTERADIAERARSLRLHGLTADAVARYGPGGPAGYDLVEPGIKANLPDLLAALGRSQLARLDDLQARRRRIVRDYREQLTAVPAVRPVPAQPIDGSADHLMVVLLPEGADRDAVRAAMRERGVMTSVHFSPLHRFEWFAKHAEIAPSGVAVAEAAADRALSLPLHPALSHDDVTRVVGALAEALSS